MAKKKILLIANEGQEGGAANALKVLAKGLKRDYHPIILMDRPGPLSFFCEKNKIDFVILKFSPFRTVEGPTALKKYAKIVCFPILFLRHFLTNWVALNKIEKSINMEEISLIHTNTNRDDFGAMLAKRFNIPHVWHIREIDNMPYKCFSFRPRRFSYINKNATRLVMISEFVAKEYVKKGLGRNRMRVVHDGIKIKSDFDKSYSDNGLKIIILGAITEGKGQMTAVGALKLLPREISRNITLDMFGFGSEYAEKIKIAAKEYGLFGISVYPFRDDIGSVLPKYDVGLSCAAAEGFGLSTVEYMENKLVTVVTNTGASPEIIIDGSGFTYEFGDAKQLSDIITYIYKMNKKQKAEWGEKAYRRSRDFSDEKHVAGIIEVYDELIG